MSAGRIFSVRINLDDMNAALMRWRSAESRADWLDGFMLGCAGVDTDGTEPFTQANKLGLTYHAQAKGFQNSQSERATKRWKDATAMPRHESGNATAMPRQCREDAISNNRIIEESNNRDNQESKQPDSSATPPRDGYDMAGFDELWEAYGKKVGKKQAVQKWRGMTQKDRDDALNGVDAYVAAKPDPQYRKDLIRYLRDRAWEDVPPAPAQVNPYPEGHPDRLNWWALNGHCDAR